MDRNHSHQWLQLQQALRSALGLKRPSKLLDLPSFNSSLADHKQLGLTSPYDSRANTSSSSSGNVSRNGNDFTIRSGISSPNAAWGGTTSPSSRALTPSMHTVHDWSPAPSSYRPSTSPIKVPSTAADMGLPHGLPQPSRMSPSRTQRSPVSSPPANTHGRGAPGSDEVSLPPANRGAAALVKVEAKPATDHGADGSTGHMPRPGAHVATPDGGIRTLITAQGRRPQAVSASQQPQVGSDAADEVTAARSKLPGRGDRRTKHPEKDTKPTKLVATATESAPKPPAHLRPLKADAAVSNSQAHALEPATENEGQDFEQALPSAEAEAEVEAEVDVKASSSIVAAPDEVNDDGMHQTQADTVLKSDAAALVDEHDGDQQSEEAKPHQAARKGRGSKKANTSSTGIAAEGSNADEHADATEETNESDHTTAAGKHTSHSRHHRPDPEAVTPKHRRCKHTRAVKGADMEKEDSSTRQAARRHGEGREVVSRQVAGDDYADDAEQGAETDT